MSRLGLEFVHSVKLQILWPNSSPNRSLQKRKDHPQMAIYFSTSQPNGLLGAFKKAIDDGHIETWSYDSDGDFTHTPPQWKNLAWMRPVISSGLLTFRFLGSQARTTKKSTYGIYHGRFIESMLTHCDERFDSAQATAMAASGDQIVKKSA